MTRTAVCTVAQVLQTAQFTSVDEVGGSDVVTEAIEEAESEVGNAHGNPNKKSTFILDSTQTRYEFRVDDKKVYRVDRVIIRDDDNTRIAYTAAATASETLKNYIEDLEFNTITLHADTVAAYDGRRLEIDFVPIEIHHLTRLKAALSLIDKTVVVNGENQTPAIAIRIMSRIKRIEESCSSALALGSTNEATYNPTFGTVIPQRRFWTYN